MNKKAANWIIREIQVKIVYLIEAADIIILIMNIIKVGIHHNIINLRVILFTKNQ